MEVESAELNHYRRQKKTRLVDAEDVGEYENLQDEQLPNEVSDVFEINLSGQVCQKQEVCQLHRVIKNATILTKITLDACFSKAEMLLQVLKGILYNEKLPRVELDIRSVAIDKECCKKIAILINNKRIQSLYLPCIQDYEMMKNILEAVLKTNVKILVLDVSFSTLSPKSLRYLVDILKKGLIIEGLVVERCKGWKNNKLGKADRMCLESAKRSMSGKPEIKWMYEGYNANGAMVDPTNSHKNTGAPNQNAGFGNFAKLIYKRATSKVNNFRENVRNMAKKRKRADDDAQPTAKKSKVVEDLGIDFDHLTVARKEDTTSHTPPVVVNITCWDVVNRTDTLTTKYSVGGNSETQITENGGTSTIESPK